MSDTEARPVDEGDAHGGLVKRAVLTLAERFWSKVDRRGPDECWLWKAGFFDDGYGCFNVRTTGPGRRTERAHRVSWTLAYGPIPDGMGVLHRCDVGACVNPAHLFLGTQLENVADMVAKGRAARRPGELATNRKLSAADVAEIRRSYPGPGVTQETLAARYGVERSTVSSILRGRTWKESACA